MTVTATELRARSPRAWRSIAQMAMMWSPSMSGPHGRPRARGRRRRRTRARYRPRVPRPRLQVVRMRRPAIVVDVASVGRGEDHVDLGAERRQHAGAIALFEPLAQSTTSRSPADRGPRASRRPRAGNACSRRRQSIVAAARCGRRARRRSSASCTRICVGSESFRPPGANSLIPLSVYALCEAEIIAPAMPSAAESHATAGVGRNNINMDAPELASTCRGIQTRNVRLVWIFKIFLIILISFKPNI